MTFNHRHAYIINLSQKEHGSIAAVLYDPYACAEAKDAGLIDEIGNVTPKGKAAVAYWIENGTYDTSSGLVSK